MEWLDTLPFWGLYIVILACGMGALEAGYQFGRFWTRRSKAAKKDSVDSLVGAILALLAFLLVFMTGIANNRFDTRRQLVITEANAVGTAYLRAGFLDEPARSEVRALLREYVGTRLEAIAVPARFVEDRARSEAIHAQLWQYAADAGRAAPQSNTLSLFAAAVNEVINVHTQRMAAIYNRFPISNWVAIGTVALLALFAVGFNDGLSDGRADGRALIAEFVLLLIFAAVLLLIIDLDRAGDGILRVSQQALIDLQQQMQVGSP